jgi:catalase
MSDKPILTTESGAPVADNQNSQTAGPAGPTLLQDQYLIEKLARFNRERIPERIVHAVGTGAYGYLEVTSADVPRWTKMRIFEKVGKKTDMFIRFSTVASSRGGPDVARDPRGFAMASSSRTSFIRRNRTHTPTARNPTTCGISSRTRPKRRTSS